jgi:hypothetical protein
VTTLEPLSIKDTDHPSKHLSLWECHRGEDVAVAVMDGDRYYSDPVAIAPADVDRLLAWLLEWKAERSPLAPRPSQLATPEEVQP